MWISDKILDNRAFDGGHSLLYDKRHLKAYDILTHSEQLLQEARDELYIVSAITSLKRAVDHRIRHLKDIYSFASIPIRNKPKRDLDLLEFFGILRPYMLLQLIQIRNQVEHHDITPPSKDWCSEFVDIVWYFLRSTDDLVSKEKDEICYIEEIDGREYDIQISFQTKADWKASISGYIPAQYYMDTPNSNWLKVNPRTFLTVKDMKENNQNDRENYLYKAAVEQNLHEEDAYIDGEIAGTDDITRKLIISYFST